MHLQYPPTPVLYSFSSPGKKAGKDRQLGSRAISSPFTGEVVVVTGAAEGLGQEAVVAFVAAGAERIAIVDSSSISDTHARASQVAREARRPGLEILSVQFEVGNAASVDAGVTAIHSRWGHADILINTPCRASSLDRQRQPLGAGDIDNWWKSWEVSVKDAFVVAHALLPLLLKGGEKTIVNIGSTSSSSLKSTSHAQDLSGLAMTRLSEGLMAVDAEISQRSKQMIDFQKGNQSLIGPMRQGHGIPARLIPTSWGHRRRTCSPWLQLLDTYSCGEQSWLLPANMSTSS